jgi:hypothetical protein
MKECPSQDEEMVQIGAFCFSSEFIYREDLKIALERDLAWNFPNLEKKPVIQLTRGEFRAPKKSCKMIFINAEKSKQHEVRSSPVKFGHIRSSPVKSGQVWSSPVKSGQVWSRPVKSGQVWSYLVKSGQVRSSPVKFGHVRSSLVKTNQIRSSVVKSGQVW